MPVTEYIPEYLCGRLSGLIQSLCNGQAQAVLREVGCDAARYLAVRMHRQAEQDHLCLGDLILKRCMISFHHRAHDPDANIVAGREQMLHSMAHFAITENQYTVFHHATSFVVTDINLKLTGARIRVISLRKIHARRSRLPALTACR